MIDYYTPIVDSPLIGTTVRRNCPQCPHHCQGVVATAYRTCAMVHFRWYCTLVHYNSLRHLDGSAVLGEAMPAVPVVDAPVPTGHAVAVRPGRGPGRCAAGASAGRGDGTCER